MIISSNESTGNIVNMLKTNAAHLDADLLNTVLGPQESDAEQSFGDLFINAFEKVNDDQVKVQKLSQDMITNPESVNVHDITVAMADAQLSLGITKAVVDGAIRAYQSIINTR